MTQKPKRKQEFDRKFHRTQSNVKRITCLLLCFRPCTNRALPLLSKTLSLYVDTYACMHLDTWEFLCISYQVFAASRCVCTPEWHLPAVVLHGSPRIMSRWCPTQSNHTAVSANACTLHGVISFFLKIPGVYRHLKDPSSLSPRQATDSPCKLSTSRFYICA